MLRSAIVIMLLSTSVNVFGGVDEKVPATVDAVRPSIIWLTTIGKSKGNPRPTVSNATGFVYQPKGESRKFIITAAHIVGSGAQFLIARLPDADNVVRNVLCDLVDRDETTDLMAVLPGEPIIANALELSPDIPSRKDLVWTVGCAGGLGPSDYSGWINADPIFADKLIVQTSGNDKPFLNASPRGNTLLLRHNATSAAGMSGAPLLDRNGKVLGVQHGAVEKTTQVCFAVSARHIRTLDLTKQPQKLKGLEFPQTADIATIHKQLQQDMLIDCDDQRFEAACIVTGDVSSNVGDFIASEYPPASEFPKRFGVNNIDNLLTNRTFVRVTNPAYGFSFVCPTAYNFEIAKRKSPMGITIHLTTDKADVDDPLRTLAIHAFVPTDYRTKASAFWDEYKSGRDHEKYSKLLHNPIALYEWKATIIDHHILGQATKQFAQGAPPHNLGLASREEDGAFVGAIGQPLYSSILYLESTNPPLTSYDYYTSDVIDYGHAIQATIRDGVVLIVHYAFNKQDRLNLLNGKPCSQTLKEQQLIRTTVKLY